MPRDDEFSSLTGVLNSGKPRSYGATPALVYSQLKKPQSIIIHTLSKLDSLQSLSVKYEVPVGDIKRINKLWNNESLSLRDTVNIPIYDDTVNCCHGQIASTSGISSQTVNLDDGAKSKILQNGVSESREISEMSGMDFLASFDSSLSSIKQRVKNQVGLSSSMLSDDEDTLFTSGDSKYSSQRGKHPLLAKGRKKGSLSSLTSSEDIQLHSTPEPVIRSKMKNKIKRHEEIQDELFQL